MERKFIQDQDFAQQEKATRICQEITEEYRDFYYYNYSNCGNYIVIITRAVNPIINDLCIDKAKNIATQISNDEATLIMNQYSYDDLITIVRDSNGNVKMLQTNTKNVNKIISDIPLNIINKFQEKNTSDIFIYLGSALGLKLFSAQGPKIHIKIANVGNVDTKLVSEFTSQGINQTLHRVYLNLSCEVTILTPYNTIKQMIENQVLIAESVIVGTVPDASTISICKNR